MQDFVEDRNVDSLVKNKPYYAFPLIACFVELLGKCLDPNPNWNKNSKKHKNPFSDAIQHYDSFIQYREIDNLEDLLRNGMIHTVCPKDGIKLASDNDINNNIIGCEDLYEAVKTTVKKIKEGVYDKLIKKSINSPYISIENGITGNTNTIK